MTRPTVPSLRGPWVGAARRSVTALLFTLLAISPAVAQTLPVSNPIADTSAAAKNAQVQAAGVANASATDIDTDTTGECKLDATAFKDQDGTNKVDEKRRQELCKNLLLPRRATSVTVTPGAFFLGYAWGSKSNQFVYGPQVSVSAAYQVPFHRPNLDKVDDPTGKQLIYALPTSMSYTFDMVFSFQTALAAFTFPNASSSTLGNSGSTQQGYNIGVYVAPELGWQWWSDDRKTPSKLVFTIGIMAGLINTTATGSAFALGLQPAISTQF